MPWKPPGEGKEGRVLHLQIRFYSTSNLADKTLEGCLPDQKLSALLVATDLTKGYGPMAMMGLLHTSSVSGLLLCSLCCKLMEWAWGFPPIDWCVICFVLATVQLSMLLFFVFLCVCFVVTCSAHLEEREEASRHKISSIIN